MKKRDRSNDSHAILDKKSRDRKACKIISVLKDEGRLKNKLLLDIGTGSGYTAARFGSVTKETTSVDVVDERRVKKGYKFKRVDSVSLPFEDSSFDIVISNHVVEHVDDQQKHIDEMIRVLKKSGIIYLATPNRLWFTDPHYRVPFIGWMPRPVAKKYLKILLNKDWDVRPLTKRAIGKLVDRRLHVKSCTVEIMKDPVKYELDTFSPIHPIIQRIPRRVLKIIDIMIPTLILRIGK